MKNFLLACLLQLSAFACADEIKGPRSARPLETPAPVYPKEEEEAGHGGKVVVALTVLADGSAKDVQVATSSGFAALDKAAVEAAQRWRFTPAVDAEGKPVDSKVRIPLTFKSPAGEIKDSIVAMLEKRCSEISAEVAAFKQSSPDKGLGEVRTFKSTTGMFFLASDKPMEQRLALIRTMPEVYAVVVERCEKNPDAIYKDVLADAAKQAAAAKQASAKP